VSNLIHEYDVNFKHLQKQRMDLIETVKNIHKDTSELIEKQKKYIDLSNSVKEALDYYTLLDKFEFNYVC
jgi:glycerol-3-phosphate cytidylyltransferase-like family protein